MVSKLQFPYTRRILTSPNFPASASRDGIKADALLSPSIKSATRVRDGSIGQLQPFKTACKRDIWLLFILLPKRGSRNCAAPCQHRDEPTDVSHGHTCAAISGQVEQEVCYDASLFKPSNRRSLKVDGSYRPFSSRIKAWVSAQISSS